MLVKKSKPFVLSSKEDGCALQEKAKKSKPFVLLLILLFFFFSLCVVRCCFLFVCYVMLWCISHITHILRYLYYYEFMNLGGDDD